MCKKIRILRDFLKGAKSECSSNAYAFEDAFSEEPAPSDIDESFS